MNKYIGNIFFQIYGKESTPTSFADRRRMESAIYFICKKGLNVGSYRFMFFRQPYSQALLEDMLFTCKNVSFKPSEELIYEMDFLKNVFIKPEHIEISEDLWTACIASITFLKEDASEEDAKLIKDQMLKIYGETAFKEAINVYETKVKGNI